MSQRIARFVASVRSPRAAKSRTPSGKVPSGWGKSDAVTMQSTPERVDDGAQRGLLHLGRHEALAAEQVARRRRQRARSRGPRSARTARRATTARTAASPRRDSSTTTRSPGWRSQMPPTRNENSVSCASSGNAAAMRGSAHVAEPVGADLAEPGAGDVVERERDVELLERRPQRVVVGALERDAGQRRLGEHEEPAEAELLDAAARFGDRGVDVAQVELADGEQPVGRVRRRTSPPSRCTPRTMAARELRVEAPGRDLHQPAARVERHLVDALVVASPSRSSRDPSPARRSCAYFASPTSR